MTQKDSFNIQYWNSLNVLDWTFFPWRNCFYVTDQNSLCIWGYNSLGIQCCVCSVVSGRDSLARFSFSIHLNSIAGSLSWKVNFPESKLQSPSAQNPHHPFSVAATLRYALLNISVKPQWFIYLKGMKMLSYLLSELFKRLQLRWISSNREHNYYIIVTTAENSKGYVACTIIKHKKHELILTLFHVTCEMTKPMKK